MTRTFTYKRTEKPQKQASNRQLNMREKALRDTTRGFFHKNQLASDSANGACACAGAAVNAQISVYFALAFCISGNCAQGAVVFTNTAADAQILINGMSHDSTST